MKKENFRQHLSSAIKVICLFIAVFSCRPADCDTFTHEFKSGWNMISFPFIPSNGRAGDMFGSSFPGAIYKVSDDGYTVINEDDYLEGGKGYWIYSEDTITLQFDGTPYGYGTAVIGVKAGWNLLGSPFYYNVSLSKTQLDTVPDEQFEKIYIYDAAAGTYQEAGEITPWNAFWVKLPASGLFSIQGEEISDTPVLIYPGNGDQVLLQDNCDGQSSILCVRFEWSGGELYDGDAPGYDIEILKNSSLPYLCEQAFAYDPADPPVPPFTNTSDAFCSLSTGGGSVVNGDVFFWRVRARDADDNPGLWSQLNQFTVVGTLFGPIQPYLDSRDTCDPVNDPDSVEENCAQASCLDMAYYWSAVPAAFGVSCYRIEISDRPDFSNLIWADTTEAPINSFPCALGQCYQAGTSDGKYIPMTNGVEYYWRVGDVVSGEGGLCGAEWNYSATWDYYKRPPMPRNIMLLSNVYGAAVSWDPPGNCTSSGGQALSIPAVPPAGGEYIVWITAPDEDIILSSTVPTATPAASSLSVEIEGLSPDTEYKACVAVADASFATDHPGHVSKINCTVFQTLPEE